MVVLDATIGGIAARRVDRLWVFVPTFLLANALALGLGACASNRSIDRPAVEFQTASAPRQQGSFPNWPVPPRKMRDSLMEELKAGRYEFLEAERTEYGGSGPEKATLFFPAFDERVLFKWKEVPRRTLESVNNSPRKEIAAYEIQKLFLEPEDYVVPTTFLLCRPLSRYAKSGWRRPPSIEGSACILGAMAVWLKDVTMTEHLYDEARFVAEHNYAYYMSNFNLLTYLIDHKDIRVSNFLISKDENRRQVFSVDNGIAFEPFLFKFFAPNWNVIRVAGLRRESVERLRRLSRQDLDVLGVVAELEMDERGIFRNLAPRENLGPNEGIRLDGDRVQIGLAKFEIDGVWKRIQSLLDEVDDGTIPVF